MFEPTSKPCPQLAEQHVEFEVSLSYAMRRSHNNRAWTFSSVVKCLPCSHQGLSSSLSNENNVLTFSEFNFSETTFKMSF